MNNITENFGSMVFDEQVMREKLPKEVFDKLQKTIKNGKSLDLSLASVVANAMKDWAVEKGVTHYTHWFQPMTGITAEKHESFIYPTDDGSVILKFSGKELVQGEPDASSFPNGGLRSTFEARGYTAWDPTAYAFIKDNVLCIPTAFCSYGAHALDKKTPLLRSMECVSREALRILKLFGNEEVKSVTSSVGPEQEYFLVDKKYYDKRRDLRMTGRTLFGAKAPKGQELDDHYYGRITSKVQSYMTDLNNELWKLGILAKTEHNEVAPAQHEFAPIYSTTNIATDHNQLTMEIMQKVAKKHNMMCLLHEKPFAGVNGSGKHNNWSLSTDTGINLIEPGKTPYENAQFLLVLSAIIKAVDEYQDLLRVSVATAGNDHRLGANEAPPAIVSMFIGEELEDILTSLVEEKPYGEKEKELMKIGVHVLPKFVRDTTDRNRTSPFAFTGNKFEFRMPGSNQSIAGINVVLNTIVAEIFSEFADILEKSTDFETDLHNLIKTTVKEHKRIIFNGNGYDDAWKVEAEKRGLLNLTTAVDALPYFVHEKNLEVFAKHKVFTNEEMFARLEIMLEDYAKAINIEAETMVDIAIKDILPASVKYALMLSKSMLSKKEIGLSVSTSFEAQVLKDVSALQEKIYESATKLKNDLKEAHAIQCVKEQATFYKDTIVVDMAKLRLSVDSLEGMVSKDIWPLPSYTELLFCND